jgi:SAM-dependent methyltransferase
MGPPTFGRPPPPPPPDRVLDLGCGTGISTRLLAEHGLDVMGMDPNEDMLALAREQGGPTYVKGEATATGLPPQSVGLVTVAQAFHWFPVPETMAELRRIVRRGGSIAAFWNIRAETPFMTAYEALLRDKSNDYEKVPRFEDTLVAILRSPHLSRIARKEFANSQTFDREGLHGRAWSSSYVAHGVVGDDARREFDAELDALFDRFAEDGRVTFQYRSLAGVARFG